MSGGRFGPEPRAFFDSIYRGPAPWDIGAPQPALTALFAAYPPEGSVLDLGCGSGDLAISLARGGLQVMGIDFADTALAQAREKAAGLPPGVAAHLQFRVADALRPSLLGQFGSVVDSGFYHLFEPVQTEAFVLDLAAALRPGGRYYLLAFATEFPIPNTPRQIDAAELRTRFAEDNGWRIRELRPAEFQSRLSPVPAIAACIERLAIKAG